MNALSKNISHWQVPNLPNLQLEIEHVFVSESEAESRAGKKRALNFIARFVSWWAWLAKASIVRSVGPGHRALDRHEFESIELRRGGFGNVF